MNTVASSNRRSSVQSSVDILNEGVDIPSLNQIIMLRPTQRFEQFTMPNSSATAVRIGYELTTPVRPDIYDYLTSDIA